MSVHHFLFSLVTPLDPRIFFGFSFGSSLLFIPHKLTLGELPFQRILPIAVTSTNIYMKMISIVYGVDNNHCSGDVLFAHSLIRLANTNLAD